MADIIDLLNTDDFRELLTALRLHRKHICSVRERLDPHVVMPCKLPTGAPGIVVWCDSPEDFWEHRNATCGDPHFAAFARDSREFRASAWPLSRLELVGYWSVAATKVRGAVGLANPDWEKKADKALLKLAL